VIAGKTLKKNILNLIKILYDICFQFNFIFIRTRIYNYLKTPLGWMSKNKHYSVQKILYSLLCNSLFEWMFKF